VQPKVLDGVNVAFEKDLDRFSTLGTKNDSTLGDLLYQFFRYYAHEFDFEENVVSVRLGSLLPKSTKGWHLLQDNRLCVEEPFNINRNLANTADDTSMRGIHLELRRAFDLIGHGRLNECCEQFDYPPEEIKPSEHLVLPQSRPVNVQAPLPQLPRGGKNNRNAGRNGAQPKGSVAARRSSNPVQRQQMHLRNLPFGMNTQELQSQAMHQQHLLHDHLFQQYQYLQMQEQELRARLNQQSMRHQSILAQHRGGHMGTGVLYGNQDDNMDSATAQAFGMQHRGPLSAPLYQARFGAPSPFLPQAMPVNGIVTNPSSPHLSSVTPDNRRFSRRTSVGQSLTGGSLRAQSQPARGLVSSISMSHLQPAPEMPDYASSRRSSASATTHDSGPTLNSQRSQPAGSTYDSARKPAEYVGYYVGSSPYLQSTNPSPMSSITGLAIHNGGLSPRVMSRSPQPSSNGRRTNSPGKSSEARAPSQESISTVTRSVRPQNEMTPTPTPIRRHAPLIVDGSVNSPMRRRTNGAACEEVDEQIALSGSTSEDMAFDTPSSSEDADEPVLSHQAKQPVKPTKAFSPGVHVANGYANDQPLLVADPNVIDSPANGIGKPHFNAHKGGLTAWTLPRQLSSVQEVRTPSPGFDMSPPLMSPFGNGVQKEGKSSPLATREMTSNGMALQPNGVVSPSSNGSSWQTPSNNRKKHRKSKKTKSENDIRALNAAGGDVLPVDDSQRKGG
jgi:hypothetical protein